MDKLEELINTLPSFINGKFVSETDLYYTNIMNQPQKMNFPVTSDCDTLINSAKLASFGKNDISVIDTNYRYAYVLQENQFATNFQPEKYNITDTIMEHMTGKPIKLILDKLNIYVEGGHFKVHKDTPKSDDMIGTLIVYFPSEFTGGELILHTNTMMTFDFAEFSKTHFQWIAFYGDIDHEIHTVTSGNRITMTYGIYGINDTMMLTEQSEIIASIGNILKDPEFMTDGGTIGYGCKYMYSMDILSNGPMNINKINNIKDIPAKPRWYNDDDNDHDNNHNNYHKIFKGDDAMLFDALKFFNLHIELKKVVVNYHDEYENTIICNCCNNDMLFTNMTHGSRATNPYNSDYYNDHINADDILSYGKLLCNNCSKISKGKEFIKKHKLHKIYNIYETKEYSNDSNTEDEKLLIVENAKKINKEIYWLNDPTRSDDELAIEAFIYGNEPCESTKIYKHCTFFINIPSYDVRTGNI